MSATPGCRLVAPKGLPRANPGLIINESSGFVKGGFADGLCVDGLFADDLRVADLFADDLRVDGLFADNLCVAHLFADGLCVESAGVNPDISPCDFRKSPGGEPRGCRR